MLVGGSADREVLAAPVLTVAARLLGARLSHTTAAGTVTVRITEVEAYAGPNDPASHAFRGPTRRTEVMFGPAGRLYVYRSHGLHWCANVVTGVDGEASAVLLRAGAVVEGRSLVRQRRGPRIPERDLTRGPGRLCQALGITDALGGVDLLGGGPVRLEVERPLPDDQILAGPRVGVSRAADRPWRFWIAGDPCVSAYRASPRRVPDSE